MTSRARNFSGTTNVSAKFNPASLPTPVLLKHGIHMGRQFYSDHPAYLSPQYCVAEKLFTNGNGAIIGLPQHGKGVLAKSMAVQFGSCQAGVDDNGCIIEHVQHAHDFKLELGEGEYAKSCQYLLGTSVDLAKQGGINIFDRRLGASTAENARLLLIAVQHTRRGEPLSSMHHYAAYLVMKTIDELEAAPSLELTRRFADPITRDLVAADRLSSDSKLRQQYADQLEDADSPFARYLEKVMEGQSLLESDDQSFYELQRAGQDLAAMITTILDSGDYGSTFGGNRSPYDLMTGNFSHFVWEGMAAKAKDLLETVFNYWLLIADREEGGASPIIPHYQWSDEQGSELVHGSTAEIRAERSRKVRARRTITCDMMQLANDYLKVGDPGSVLRGHGQTIFNNLGFAIIGRQPYDDDVLDAITRLGATDPEAFTTTRLPQAGWGVLSVRTGRPMEWFMHDLKPSIIPLIDTTGQATRSGRRVNVADGSYNPPALVGSEH